MHDWRVFSLAQAFEVIVRTFLVRLCFDKYRMRGRLF